MALDTFWRHSLTHRRRQPEIMDQPDLDPRRHFQALRGLERINFFSGSARIVWPPIAALVRDTGLSRLRVLDIATGGGDVPIRLWYKARRAGLNLDIEGCDRSPTAIAYAQERAREKGALVRFFPFDVLQETIPGPYDVVVSSLFLHHLDEDEAIGLLRRMAQAASRLVLINDLNRSITGYLLAYAGTRLLTTSGVVHVDGPRSVEAAFTMPEALDLARRAGLEGATIGWRWPCRYLLSWRRP